MNRDQRLNYEMILKLRELKILLNENGGADILPEHTADGKAEPVMKNLPSKEHKEGAYIFLSWLVATIRDPK